MGIFLNLHIVPERIPAKRWEAVYHESLRLVEAFDFLDRRTDTRNGLQYSYAVRTEHQSDIGNGYAGWSTIGDMRHGPNTEDFYLNDDIEAYKIGAAMSSDADILLSIVPGIENMEGIQPPDTINIWGGKTQGRESHIPLLAIACLICDRLPHDAIVGGDISAGQCWSAVRWANQYLDEPIDIPVVCRKEALLNHLKKSGIPREKLLGTFFALTEESKGGDMGELVRQEFSTKEISAYYAGIIKTYKWDTIGSRNLIKEYLQMGFGLAELCRLYVFFPDGPHVSPEEFIDHIIDAKLHIKEKETWDYTVTSTMRKGSEDVDTIEDVFTRLGAQLGGAGNRNVDAYMPLEEIRDIFRDAFGEICDVDAVLESALHKEPDKDSVQSFLYDDTEVWDKLAEITQEEEDKIAEKYDIITFADFYEFVPGKSKVRPGLEESIIESFKNLHEFAKKRFAEFKTFDREKREYHFIRSNRHILVDKKVWDRIFDRVMDDEYIERLFAISIVDCEYKEQKEIVQELLRNLNGIDYFWELTK